jgi:hypothetical protein
MQSFPSGILTWLGTEENSIIETELQVSEQVTGFTEQRGPNKESHFYDQVSPYTNEVSIGFFAPLAFACTFRS